MTSDAALGMVEQMLWLTLLVGGPVIGASMVVGLLVSIIQVATQIQEMTLTFIPKLLVIFGVLVTFGSWMLSELIQFGTNAFLRIPTIGGG
jgi:flagellar biosynthesis protein FliQ